MLFAAGERISGAAAANTRMHLYGEIMALAQSNDALHGKRPRAHMVRGAAPSHGISGTLEIAFFGEPVKTRSE